MLISFQETIHITSQNYRIPKKKLIRELLFIAQLHTYTKKLEVNYISNREIKFTKKEITKGTIIHYTIAQIHQKSRKSNTSNLIEPSCPSYSRTLTYNQFNKIKITMVGQKFQI